MKVQLQIDSSKTQRYEYCNVAGAHTVTRRLARRAGLRPVQMVDARKLDALIKARLV